MRVEVTCLGCGQEAASLSTGTSPLCGMCAVVAQQNVRGVKRTEPVKESSDSRDQVVPLPAEAS